MELMHLATTGNIRYNDSCFFLHPLKNITFAIFHFLYIFWKWDTGRIVSCRIVLDTGTRVEANLKKQYVSSRIANIGYDVSKGLGAALFNYADK